MRPQTDRESCTGPVDISFMVDEGIVSSYQAAGEAMLLRFTYDRFFEIMMARHLMHVLSRDNGGNMPSVDRIAQWLGEVGDFPIYTDVMAWLLAILQSQKVASEIPDEEIASRNREASSAEFYTNSSRRRLICDTKLS